MAAADDATLEQDVLGQRSGVAQSSRINALPEHSAPREAPRRRRGPTLLSRLATILFVSSMLALLYAAWQQSDEEYIVPDTGLGYWLGIASVLIVLGGLAYPWRKS